MSLSVHKGRLELDLIAKVEPVIQSLGYELRDLEVLGSGASAIVRVILDKDPVTTTPAVATAATASADEDGDEGRSLDTIGIEDCSRVHQLLGPMFDVWDPLPHAYALEVTSPGEKPNLRTLKHFTEALGQKIHFQTIEAVPMPAPMKPRRNWEGELAAIDEGKGEILMKDGYGEHRVPLGQIKTATWLREWAANGNENPKAKKPHPKAKERAERENDKRKENKR